MNNPLNYEQVAVTSQLREIDHQMLQLSTRKQQIYSQNKWLFGGTQSTVAGTTTTTRSRARSRARVIQHPAAASRKTA